MYCVFYNTMSSWLQWNSLFFSRQNPTMSNKWFILCIVVTNFFPHSFIHSFDLYSVYYSYWFVYCTYARYIFTMTFVLHYLYIAYGFSKGCSPEIGACSYHLPVYLFNYVRSFQNLNCSSFNFHTRRSKFQLKM